MRQQALHPACNPKYFKWPSTTTPGSETTLPISLEEYRTCSGRKIDELVNIVKYHLEYDGRVPYDESISTTTSTRSHLQVLSARPDKIVVYSTFSDAHELLRRVCLPQYTYLLM